MEHNFYLGPCYSIVYRPTADEVLADGLRSDSILLLLKTSADLSAAGRPEDLHSVELFDSTAPILLRIASECLLGAFGDTHCDCEAQRVAALREIHRVGQGVYVHMPQEAQGQGLFYKAQELHLQVSGIDPLGTDVGQKSVTEASSYLLGRDGRLDLRDYNSLKSFFGLLDLARYQYLLISESPPKAKFLKERLGLKITGLHGVRRPISSDNSGEYLAKLYNKRYTVTDHELQDIYHALFAAHVIPGRVLNLLGYIREDLAMGREFPGNMEIIGMISRIPKERGLASASVTNLDLLQDAESYDEYQTEVAASLQEVENLFEERVFLGIESLRYEINYFYDLAEYDEVPARSLKIRDAFRLDDLERPMESKLIYKIPTGDRTFRVKTVQLHQKDTAQLLKVVLEHYRRHVVPVLTHNVKVTAPLLTVLLKRYSAELRAISIMGEQQAVSKFLSNLRGVVPAPEIADPTNYRSIDPTISLGFNVQQLGDQELALFRERSLG